MKLKIILVLIVFLATLLRLTYLSTDPPSLNWDEASVGWNAYSLLKTGSDEYGNHFPITIRSFNDYKPAVYTYSVIPAVAFFGLSELAVRLPAALAGIAAVFVTYLFVEQLLKFGRKKSHLTSLLAALLVAVSPWHLQFSRIAFEASLALLFFVTGATLLLIYFNKLQNRYLFLSVFCFVLSAYTHHSVKLILPIFLLCVVLFYHKFLLKQWKSTLLAGLLFLILILPLTRSLFRPSGQASRFLTVSIFAQQNSPHNQNLPLPILLTENYLSHLDPRFLFFGVGDNPRHHAPNSGGLLLWSLPWLLVGLAVVIQTRPQWRSLILTWFALAPMAAIFSIDTPHASRSFLYLPIYDVLASVGLSAMAKYKYRLLTSWVSRLLLSTLFIVNLVYFSRQYFLILPKQDALSWQFGYKQLVSTIRSKEKDYQKIYITNAYDQPYIYFLFYGQSDLRVKNDGSFFQQIGKYQFVNFKSWGESSWSNLDKNVLLALSFDDPTAGAKKLDEIKSPDGKVVFQLAEM